MHLPAKLSSFFKKEAVLWISFVCAAVSMIFVPPDEKYPGYIDLRVLILLFCLMAVVAGLRRQGLFELLSQKLTGYCKTTRGLLAILIFLPFFSSMAVTNDVALITFVPFAILTLQGLSLSSLLIPTIVLQTIAANLGSMATPVGNPQNLFLYSFYGLSAQDFFGTVLPVTAISLALLMGAVFCFPSKPLKAVSSHDAPKPGLLKLCLFLSLFALCLLTVFHLLPAGILLLFTIAVLLLWERSLFSQVDYSLLFTFVCFFIFAGNIGRIPLISETLRSLMETSPLLSSVLASQLISNVPAAVLLSGFTQNSRALLLGVNIGGLGTPIASLASLISMKYYWNLPGAQKGKYLLTFLLANLFGLLLLLIFTFLFR